MSLCLSSIGRGFPPWSLQAAVNLPAGPGLAAFPAARGPPRPSCTGLLATTKAGVTGGRGGLSVSSLPRASAPEEGPACLLQSLRQLSLFLGRGAMEQGLSAFSLYCTPVAAAAAATTACAMDQEQLQVNGEREFENVELGVLGKKKIPRRVIHFASGETMEEYSTDEEDDQKQEKKDLLPSVDPATLTWGPYFWFQMLRVATSTLSVCDFLGEKIASVLGISTPKYQYAIDEYYRMKKEEEEEEEDNKLSEEAERRFQEQHRQSQEGTAIQTAQPGATFANLNFESEVDCQSAVETKQDFTAVTA